MEHRHETFETSAVVTVPDHIQTWQRAMPNHDKKLKKAPSGEAKYIFCHIPINTEHVLGN